MTGAKRGFTLVEVIISIATLSLISVFILQMFIVSAQMNRDAADIDRAVALSASVMDSIRARGAAADVRDDALFRRALIERRSERELAFTLYFDNEWDALPDGEAASYTLTAYVTEPPDEEAAQSMNILASPLTYISVKVQRNAASGASVMTLADLTGAHYYEAGR